MTEYRGYPPTNRPPYVRPTSITPAQDTSAADVLAAAARLRTARIAGDAMDPAAIAVLAAQLLERGHYRAAAAAAELAGELADITPAAATAALTFGRPRDAENCAYPGDHEHDHDMCLDALDGRVQRPGDASHRIDRRSRAGGYPADQG